MVGEGIYKQFRYTEGSLKQHSFQKSDPLNYLSHAWLSESRLLLGSDCGKVQLYEGGELKNEFEVKPVLSPDSSRSPSHAAPRGSYEPHGECVAEVESTRVACVLTYSKGFICSGGSGLLHLFEKTDEKNVFKRVRSLGVCVDPSSQLDIPSERASQGQGILSMSLSPSEENVVCTTGSQQLYSLTLSAADLGKARLWWSMYVLVCTDCLGWVFILFCRFLCVSTYIHVLHMYTVCVCVCTVCLLNRFTYVRTSLSSLSLCRPATMLPLTFWLSPSTALLCLGWMFVSVSHS